MTNIITPPVTCVGRTTETTFSILGYTYVVITVEQCRRKKRLGKSEFSEVWLASHNGTGHSLVLKMVSCKLPEYLSIAKNGSTMFGEAAASGYCEVV